MTWNIRIRFGLEFFHLSLFVGLSGGTNPGRGSLSYLPFGRLQ